MSNPGPAITISNHPQNIATNQALRLIAAYQGINLNAVADTVAAVVDSNSWQPTSMIVTNASVSLTTAQLSVYTGPNATGTLLFGPRALTALTDANKVDSSAPNATDRRTVNNLYLRCTTAQGAAATADVYIYGYDFGFLP